MGRLKGPSMEIFYENLGFVIGGGDHWLFEDMLDPCLATGSYEDVVPSEAEVELLSGLSFLLSYDASDSALEDTRAFQAGCLHQMYLAAHDQGKPFTAKQFVRIYFSAERRVAGAERSFREARSRCNLHVHNLMKDDYHKTKK